MGSKKLKAIAVLGTQKPEFADAAGLAALRKEHAAKIDPSKKARGEAALEKIKAAIKDGATEAIKSAMEALNTEMQAVSADLYSQAKNQRPGADNKAGQPADGAENPKKDGQSRDKPPKGDGDVIDADFEMVDDKK